MRLLDISFSCPEDNILFDEALLRMAEENLISETLRLWESSRVFIVLGRTADFRREIYLQNVRRDHVPVLRRFSGGGTVLQGKGCLNYALILSKERHPALRDLHASYRWILDQVLGGLQEEGIEAQYQPFSDLALSVNKKKFSGNAQHRGRKCILHHGTILYNFDLGLMEKYLQMPLQMPEYRQGRPHGDFAANLALPREKIRAMLLKVFKVTEREKTLHPQEKIFLDQLRQAQVVRINLA